MSDHECVAQWPRTRHLAMSRLKPIGHVDMLMSITHTECVWHTFVFVLTPANKNKNEIAAILGSNRY